MPLLPPIANKELRPLLRSRQAFWLLLLTLLSVGAVIWFYWADNIHGGSSSQMARYGRELFYIVAFGLLCTLGLISPIVTATAITVERENKTLDLLFCSGLKRRQILFGKLFANLAFQILIVLCMTPILILPFQLGGIGADEILYATLIIVTAVVTYGMLGLAVSSRVRKTAAALVLTLFVVLMLSAVIPIGMVAVYNLSPSRTETGLVCAPSPLMNMIMLADSAMSSRGVLRTSNLQLYFAFQAVLLLLSWMVAMRGLARRKSSEHHAVARKIIDDPAVLERRRKRWPYYLIDPQRRAQAISDTANPLYIKEKRTGVLSRPTVLIRLGYAGALISLIMVFFITMNTPIYERYEDENFVLLCWLILGPLALFIISQVATALTREREEKTLDLLRVTLLKPREIVWAKFRIVMRFVLFVCFVLLLVPVFLLVVTSPFSHGAYQRDWLDLVDVTQSMFKAAIFTGAFAAFYAALGLYWSSRCRRTVPALVLSYFSGLALLVLPFVASIFNEVFRLGYRYGSRSSLNLIDIFDRYAGPIISPLYYFMSWLSPRDFPGSATVETMLNGTNSGLDWDRCDAWGTLLLRMALVLLLTWVLLRLSARRLERK